MVLPFAALETLAVGICFLIFSRHVLDQERIVVDGSQVRSVRPNWSKRVRSFADFSPDPTKLVSWFSRDEGGKPTQEIHPEIRMQNLADVPPHFRGSVVKDMNKKRLRQMFNDIEAA